LVEFVEFRLFKFIKGAPAEIETHLLYALPSVNNFVALMFKKRK